MGLKWFSELNKPTLVHKNTPEICIIYIYGKEAVPSRVPDSKRSDGFSVTERTVSQKQSRFQSGECENRPAGGVPG